MKSLVDKNTRKKRSIIGISILVIIVTMGYILFNNRSYDGEYEEGAWLLSNYNEDQYLVIDSYSKYVQFTNQIETTANENSANKSNLTTILEQYNTSFFQEYSLVCVISYNAEESYPVYVKEKEETVYIKICKQTEEERIWHNIYNRIYRFMFYTGIKKYNSCECSIYNF